MLSALTLLGLHEMAARHATYTDLADGIRVRFTDPRSTLQELFRRVVVNVLIGNTDDHPRNHAAFWDGNQLELTPAFDLCPQPHRTGEAALAMAFGDNEERRARLSACVAAHHRYGLSEPAAAAIVEDCVAVVRDQYDDACAAVGASTAARDLLWEGAVFNKSIFYPLD